MINFTYNVLMAAWVFVGWYFAGLGPAWFLLPKGYSRAVWLLAPLIGLCLLTLIGLLQITVLLSPISPRVNLAALVFISLLLCAWMQRQSFNMHSIKPKTASPWLVGLPLIQMLVFAWLFHHDGFQLLLGSSDQLQYCLDAKQILEEMHTGSINDLPVARYDHIVSDLVTRILPYSKNYRRGAEVMLAQTTAITGLSYQAAFPLLILSGLMTLGLVLGFIGIIFLNFSERRAIVLQLVFLSSFYLLLLHIQGSLALVLGIAPNLMALALLSSLMSEMTWGLLLLTAVVIATYFSIYSEPALVNLILPSLLLLGWQTKLSWSKGSKALVHLILVYLLVLLFAPFAVYAVVFSMVHNLHDIFSGSLHAFSSPAALYIPSPSVEKLLQQWNLAGVVLGSNSYYDTSVSNAHIATMIAKVPWSSVIAFFALCGCGFLGLIKNKNRLASLFAVPLLLWSLLSLLMSYQQDGVRFARSLHYAMPYMLFGLVALAGLAKKNITLAVIGNAVLVVFILMNSYTYTRTINYLVAHDVTNDPIVLRFDERHALWQLLRKELAVSAKQDTPVLLSGFRETIRPLAIIANLPSQAHVLGKSIFSFWPLYTLQSKCIWPIYDAQGDCPWSIFNTRVTAEQLKMAQYQQNQQRLQQMELSYIKAAIQAVVPIGHGYPEEWVDTQDVFPPRIKHFSNIADVVYRKEFTLQLDATMISNLQKDKSGPFRLLWASGQVRVLTSENNPHYFIVDYDGNKEDLRLFIADRFYSGQPRGRTGQYRIVAEVYPEDAGKLRLAVMHTVKLRSMAWEEH